MSKQYLSLPVKRRDYQITEGWIYTNEEREIHGYAEHGAVDFALPRGSEVLAAAAGYAIASYSRYLTLNEKYRKQMLYKGKPIGFDLGYFVQIYHPESGRYTEYGHLEKIAGKIPFSIPRQMKDGRFIPFGHKINPSKYSTYKNAVWVERGDVIGFIGDSGLSWGYEDYPVRPDPNEFPSWDKTHLHFEEFSRNKYRRRVRRDPYDIYKDYTYYPQPSHLEPFGKKHIWLHVVGGLPK